MTAWWLIAACLAIAVFLAGGPAGQARARRRVVLPGPDAGSAGASPGQPRSTGYRRWRSAVGSLASASPRRTVLVAVVVAGCAGAVAGGPVAAIVVAAYGGLAARGALRRRSVLAADRAHRRHLDDLCALAADLRAGLPPPVALPSTALPMTALSTASLPMTALSTASQPGRRNRPGHAKPEAGGRTARSARLALAAVRLAEQTGAPLADLVERIEADARAMDRGLAAADAQAAGARATAWLLAGLPLGGIALGYGIGVDPLEILLHTPIGAGCALGAVALQLAGLAWAGRLSSGVRTA